MHQVPARGGDDGLHGAHASSQLSRSCSAPVASAAERLRASRCPLAFAPRGALLPPVRVPSRNTPEPTYDGGVRTPVASFTGVWHIWRPFFEFPPTELWSFIP